MLRDAKIWVSPGVVFWQTNKRYFFIDRASNKYGEIDRNTYELLSLCNGVEFSKIPRGLAGQSSKGKKDVSTIAGSIKYLFHKEMITNIDLKKRLLKINKRRAKGIVVFCELTRACNSKCVMCYNNSGNSFGSEMSLGDWKLVIEDISRLANCTLVLTGGEPMMRRDIFSIIKYAKERGHSVEMISNGWFISKNNADILAHLQVDHIRLSLNGGKETHDLIHGRKGSFSKVVKATHFLQEVGISTSWLVTLMRQNIKEIPTIFQLASSMGVSNIKFGFVVGIGRAAAHANDMILSPEEELLTRQTILQVGREYEQTVNVDSGCEGERDNVSRGTRWSFLKNSMCGAGISCFHITSSGYVTICPLLGPEDRQLGHILKDGVRILREAPLVKMFLETSLEEFDSCKTCGLRYLCLGGCRASAFFLTGSLTGCDRNYKDYVSLLLDHLVEFK